VSHTSFGLLYVAGLYTLVSVNGGLSRGILSASPKIGSGYGMKTFIDTMT